LKSEVGPRNSALDFDTGPKGPKLEGQQANRELEANHTREEALSGARAIFRLTHLSTISNIQITTPLFGKSAQSVAFRRNWSVWSSLFSTLPITKKYKYTKVTEAQKKVHVLMR